jgi:putative solute:sodium symporter small subunit
MRSVTRYWQRNLRLIGWLLALWFVVSFGIAFFARELAFDFFGSPFSFWVASQGALVVYLVIVVVYIWRMERLDGELDDRGD